MNRSYRLVWSTRNNAFVPVAENMPARGKRSRSGASLAAAAMVPALALGAVTAFGQQAPPLPAPTALPTGAQVVSGQSTITQHGNTLDITQTTQKSIINWQSFNVGAQAQVDFHQNNSSSVSLDRVVGGNLSQIEGRINANGQVFLVNPNGVNRHSSATPIGIEQIEAAISHPVAFKLPNSVSDLEQTSNLGQTIPPRGKSEFGKQMVRWVTSIAGPMVKQDVAPPGKKLPLLRWVQPNQIAQ